MQFDHEKLHVYQASLEFNRRVHQFMISLKDIHRHARDQLIRASLSIPLNIAEGNGKRSLADRRRFFEIARGSAMECSGLLDILASIEALPDDETKSSKEILLRIVAMLSKMTEAPKPYVNEPQ